jgi:hypothetical protein
LELQTAFVDTAREDYMEVVQKLMALSREMAESCAGRLAKVSKDGNGKDQPT